MTHNTPHHHLTDQSEATTYTKRKAYSETNEAKNIVKPKIIVVDKSDSSSSSSSSSFSELENGNENKSDREADTNTQIYKATAQLGNFLSKSKSVKIKVILFISKQKAR